MMKILLVSLIAFILYACSSSTLFFANAQQGTGGTSSGSSDIKTLEAIQSQYGLPQWPPGVYEIEGCQPPVSDIRNTAIWDMNQRFGDAPSIADQVYYFAGNFSQQFPRFASQCLIDYWTQNQRTFNPMNCQGDDSHQGSGSSHGSNPHGGSGSGSSSSSSNDHSFNSDLPGGSSNSNSQPPNSGSGTQDPISQLMSDLISSVLESMQNGGGSNSDQPSDNGPSPSEFGGGSSNHGSSNHGGSNGGSSQFSPGSSRTGEDSSSNSFGGNSFGGNSFGSNGGSNGGSFPPVAKAREAVAQNVPACTPFGDKAGCLMHSFELYKLSLLKTYFTSSPSCWCKQLNRGNTACANPVTTQQTRPMEPTPTPAPPTRFTTAVTTMMTSQQQQSTPVPSSTRPSSDITTATSGGNVLPTPSQSPTTTQATRPQTTASVTPAPPTPAPPTPAPPTTRAPTTAAPPTTRAPTTRAPQTTTMAPPTAPTTTLAPGETTAAPPTTTTPAPTMPPTSVEATMANPTNFNTDTAANQIAAKLAIDKSSIGITKLNGTAVEISFTGPNAAQNVRDFLNMNSTELGDMDLSAAKAAPGDVVTPAPTPETSDGSNNMPLIGAVIGVVIVVLIGGFFAYRKWSSSGGTGSSANGKGGMTQAFNLDYDEDLMLNGNNEFTDSSEGGTVVSNQEMMRL